MVKSQNGGNFSEVKIITENDLKKETILIEEFRFRGESLKQAASDITSTLNQYFLLISISITAVGVMSQMASPRQIDIQLVVPIAIISFGCVNFLFFVRFIHLVHIHIRHKQPMDQIRS